jgi:hypothetical protein
MSKRILLAITLTGLLLAGCGGDLASPPLIYLVSNGELVDGFQSSYCWDQGIGGGICKDTVEPYFESSTPLDENAPIQFQLDAPLPKEVTISISKEVFGETILSENVPASEFIEWSPAVAPGEYIIVVHAKWKQGVVSYWFSVSLE